MNSRTKFAINSEEKTKLIDNKARYKNIVELINSGKITSKINFNDACIKDLDNAREIYTEFKKLSDRIIGLESIELPLLLKLCQRKSIADAPYNSYFANLFSCWCRPQQAIEEDSNTDDEIVRPDSPVLEGPPKRKQSYKTPQGSSSDDDYYHDAQSQLSSSPLK